MRDEFLLKGSCGEYQRLVIMDNICRVKYSVKNSLDKLEYFQPLPSLNSIFLIFTFRPFLFSRQCVRQDGASRNDISMLRPSNWTYSAAHLGVYNQKMENGVGTEAQQKTLLHMALQMRPRHGWEEWTKTSNNEWPWANWQTRLRNPVDRLHPTSYKFIHLRWLWTRGYICIYFRTFLLPFHTTLAYWVFVRVRSRFPCSRRN